MSRMIEIFGENDEYNRIHVVIVDMNRNGYQAIVATPEKSNSWHNDIKHLDNPEIEISNYSETRIELRTEDYHIKFKTDEDVSKICKWLGGTATHSTFVNRKI